MPGLIRKICEKYQCLPTDLEDQTYDQLSILVLPEADLMAESIQVIDGNSIPGVAPGAPSKAQLVRAQTQRRRHRDKKQNRRDRLAAEAKRLAEARERGEV